MISQESKQAVHEYHTNKRIAFARATSRGDGNVYSFIREDRCCRLLSYDGPEPVEEKDQASYASSERGALDPDPRHYIERVEAYMLTSVLPAGRM